MKGFAIILLLISLTACVDGVHQVQTNYHQNSPYNKEIDGNKAGCAPVAIAQVVNYYEPSDNVSSLIKEIIEESNTKLGKKKSSTEHKGIEKALKHFGFDSKLVLVNIYKELENQKTPSLVTIKIRDSYHCAIIDGYNEDGEFHINFGWGWGYDNWFTPKELKRKKYRIVLAITDIKPMNAEPLKQNLYNPKTGE